MLKETREDFSKVYDINVSGCTITTQAFLPLLKASRGAIATKYPAKVVFITSFLGSLTAAPQVLANMPESFHAIAYNASKAALNYVNAAFAQAEPSVGFYAVHPGWVKTDLGSANAPVEVADSAQALRALFESRTKEDSGKFFDIIGHGAIIPY